MKISTVLAGDEPTAQEWASAESAAANAASAAEMAAWDRIARACIAAIIEEAGA